MTPAYFDNSISMPSAEPVVALRFSPPAAVTPDILTPGNTFSNYLQRASQEPPQSAPPTPSPASTASNTQQQSPTSNTASSTSPTDPNDSGSGENNASPPGAGQAPNNGSASTPPDATAANQAAAAQTQTPPPQPSAWSAGATQAATQDGSANTTGPLGSSAASNGKLGVKSSNTPHGNGAAGPAGAANSAAQPLTSPLSGAAASAAATQSPTDPQAATAAAAASGAADVKPAVAKPALAAGQQPAAQLQSQVPSPKTIPSPAVAAAVVSDTAGSSKVQAETGQATTGVKPSPSSDTQAATEAAGKTTAPTVLGTADPAQQAAASANAVAGSITGSSAVAKGTSPAGAQRASNKSQYGATSNTDNSSGPSLQNPAATIPISNQSQSAQEAADATSPAPLPAADATSATTTVVAAAVVATAVVAGTVDAANLSNVAAVAGAVPVPTTDVNLGSTSQAAQGLTPQVAGTSQAPTSAGSQAAGQSGGADNTSGVDRVRFVQRVANAFQTIGNGDGTLRLRLSPPDLGSLKLEVTVRDGVMSARLEAETTQARDLLVDNLPALRERLNEQNIKVDKFVVDLSGQSTGGLPQRSAQDTGYQQNGPQSGGGQTTRSATATNAAVSAAAPAPAQIIGTDQLNVVI